MVKELSDDRLLLAAELLQTLNRYEIMMDGLDMSQQEDEIELYWRHSGVYCSIRPPAFSTRFSIEAVSHAGGKWSSTRLYFKEISDIALALSQVLSKHS